MDYAPYPTYRDSGIEWLGNIPDHWEVLAIKRFTMIKRGASPRPIDDTKYFDDDGEYAWVRIADVTANNHYLMDTTQRLSELGKSYSVPLESGQIFLSIAGSVGKPMISKIKCCIHDGFVYFSSLEQEPEFLYYIFESGQPFLGLGKLGTQLNLNTDTVGGVIIGLPPISEQATIARFLDHKTQQIDQLIAKKQTLIDKLNEQRIALITHAVTKGLNPDVKMKDSGVEWLGEVPEHWEIFRLRFLVDQIEQGWSPQCFNYPADDDVWGVLKVGCVNGNQFNEIENKELPNDIEPRIEYEIRAGDILISRANTKELLGSAALVSDSVRSHLLLCDKLYRLISNKTLINEFFILFLRSFATRPHYEKEATGASGSMQNIGQDTVKNLPLTVPPIAEQREIVAYLEEKTGRIDRMVALNQQAIDKLKEYRTALITAAVTGKMDVRHWQQESNHANS